MTSLPVSEEIDEEEDEEDWEEGAQQLLDTSKSKPLNVQPHNQLVISVDFLTLFAN